MANTKQAKKRAAQSDRLRLRNRAVVTKVRNIVRGIRKTSETDAKAAVGLLPMTISQLDVAVRKGVLHRKTASRLKSRVTLSTNKALAAPAPVVVTKAPKAPKAAPRAKKAAPSAKTAPASS